MPGENCAVFGCGSSRRKKVIGIWKLPKAKDESYAKWRDEWLGEIKKTRDLDLYKLWLMKVAQFLGSVKLKKL